VLVALALISTGLALALENSLPDRIGPDDYSHFIWGQRICVAALVIALFTAANGAVFGRGSLAFFGCLSIVGLFLGLMPAGFHSGPSPEMWCWNNLRKIDGAKELFAEKHHLTNGTDIANQDIAAYIEGGFSSLKCFEGGKYIVGAVGAEPRCSFHGSISDMMAGHPYEEQQTP
jgi:hypothetical protein